MSAVLQHASRRWRFTPVRDGQYGTKIKQQIGMEIWIILIENQDDLVLLTFMTSFILIMMNLSGSGGDLIVY